MQSYVMKLTAGATRSFGVKADLFVYESGTATPADGDTRIRVKPDTGAEMVLRPGQRFRLAPGSEATRFEVSALDPAVTLDGYVVIGSGEFDDANTLNKVTLDATLANNVTVMNTPANRVNVALDPNNLISTTAPLMSYTTAKSNVNAVASGYTAVFTAAENVAGIILEQLYVSGPVNMLGKATIPTAATDGDVYGILNTTTTVKDRIKVPAGKALWLYNGSGSQNVTAHALITVL